MAFVLPAFPLLCNVWRGSGAGGALLYKAPDLQVMGNLSPGRRVMLAFPIVTPATIGFEWNMELLLPKLTDIRVYIPPSGTLTGDIIECPAGSERIYQVRVVDDIGKGFANEHRMVLMYQALEGTNFNDVGFIPWPQPLP
jgi:hypothetical protein